MAKNKTSNRHENQQHPKWEYMINDLAFLNTEKETILNLLGQDGWEAVGFTGNGSVLLKRKASKRRKLIHRRLKSN